MLETSPDWNSVLEARFRVVAVVERHASSMNAQREKLSRGGVFSGDDAARTLPFIVDISRALLAYLEALFSVVESVVEGVTARKLPWNSIFLPESTIDQLELTYIAKTTPGDGCSPARWGAIHELRVWLDYAANLPVHSLVHLIQHEIATVSGAESPEEDEWPEVQSIVLGFLRRIQFLQHVAERAAFLLASTVDVLVTNSEEQ